MENAGEKYGHILETIRATKTCPELRIRLNNTTDLLYINSYKDGEEAFELGFTFDGQIVLLEQREEEYPFDVIKTTTLNVKARYRYSEDQSGPVNCTLTYIDKSLFFSYDKDSVHLRRYINDNIYIDFEVDIAISMIEKGFLGKIRDHLGLRVNEAKGDWPETPVEEEQLRSCSAGEAKEDCHIGTEAK